MDKYNNGKPINIPENEKEKALAISEWAEGNEHLQNAISACINSGIQTYASCKGHGVATSPYISLRVTSQNIEQVINIMNNVLTKRGINIALSFNEIGQGSILTVYSNIINRNAIFDLIASSAEKSLEFDKANDIVKEMLRLHETLRVYGYKSDRMRSIIELYNGLMNRKFYLKHDIGSYDYLLETELDRSNFIKKKDAQGFHLFSLIENKFVKRSSNIKRFNIDLISSFMQENCEMIEDDEFISEIEKDSVRREIKERVIGKKGDTILENVFDDRQLAKIINDKTLNLMNRLKISGIDIKDIIKKYPTDALLTTKLSKKHTVDIVKEFFKSVGIDVSELLQTTQSINESGQSVYLMFDSTVKRNETSSPTYKSDDIRCYVKETGTLTDAYALVHEVSHTFYIQNGFNETRMILGEVVPQCMERMFDEYLINLTKRKREFYGFNDQIISENIKTRKISTAIDRLEISREVNKYDKAKKAECTRYMLAQIYSTKFMKFDENEKKKRILDFISALKNNNLQQANAAFDIKIDKNNINARKEYVNYCMWDLQQLILDTSDEKSIKDADTRSKQIVENKYIEVDQR